MCLFGGVFKVTPGNPGWRDRVTLANVERPELTISVHRTPGEATVNLTGEIDMLTATRLSNTVNDILSDPPPRIVLNLAGVTFCDSQGLGTLVVLSRKASTAQSVLVLTNVGDFLLRVLDITGLRSALMIRNEPAAR
jgi:anti-sigma B factor antagonist